VPPRQAGSMISKQWVKQTRAYFLTFLRATHFPELERQGNGELQFAIQSG
jgi:hypothetical protein